MHNAADVALALGVMGLLAVLGLMATLFWALRKVDRSLVDFEEASQTIGLQEELLATERSRLLFHHQLTAVDLAEGCPTCKLHDERRERDNPDPAPEEVPGPECGYRFESKHGRPAVCAKRKGHRGDHVGELIRVEVPLTGFVCPCGVSGCAGPGLPGCGIPF